MTVGELRAIIKDLPDDMLVACYGSDGYLDWEFCGAAVVDDPVENPLRYPQPSQPYLEID